MREHDDFRVPKEVCGFARGLICFRGFLLFLTAIGALFLGAVYFAQGQIDPVVERLVEQELNKQLAANGVRVELGGARFVEGEGVIVRDARILQSNADQSLIATIDKVHLVSKVRKIGLFDGGFKPEEVIFSGVTIHARPTYDQGKVFRWNLQRLFVTRETPMDLVPMRLTDSSIKVYRDAQASEPVLELSDISLTMLPRSDSGASTVAVEGSFSGAEMGRVQFMGAVDAQTQSWGVCGKSTGMKVNSTSILKKLPAELVATLPASALTGQVSGHVDCQFNVRGVGMRNLPNFEVTGDVSRGRISHSQMPVPLSEMTANFAVKNDSIAVKDIHAETTLGKIDLTFAKNGFLDQNGKLSPGPITLTANMPRLFLNQRLAANAPDKLKTEWAKFMPSGPVKLDATFVYEDGKLQHDLTCDLLDVAITYHTLPYRLEGCRGRIHCTNETMTAEVAALAAGAIVHFDGEFQNPGPQMTGTLTFRCDGQVPIDEKLIASLEPNKSLHTTVRQYRPTGMVSGHGWITRSLNQVGQIVEDKDYTIDISEMSAVYEHFPYPFSGIQGRIRVQNDLVLYQNIEGFNGGGRATMEGSLDPRNGLSLTFNLHSIDLEEELKHALSENLQSVWESMRPRGSVDHAVVILNKAPGRELEIDAKLEKFKQSDAVQRDPLSIFPTWFPYRTTDVVGAVRYQNGRLTIHRLSGNHGDTRLSIAGGGRFDVNQWFINLTSVNFDRLVVDHDLIAALPDKFGDALKGLDVKGMLNIEGDMQVSDQQVAKPQMAGVNANSNRIAQVAFVAEEPQRVPTIEWNLQVDMADGSMATALPLTNIYGGARFIGKSNASGFYSSGRIDADSLLCKGIPLTQVSGPIWVDTTRIGLGGWAAPVKVDAERQMLTANVFGGKLTVDTMIALSEQMPFQVQATVERADLKQTMLELSPQTDNIAGLGFAGLRLSGDSRGSHTYKGDGWVRLTSATISEVPVMLAMLKLLSVKQVNRTAFNESNIDFNIEGDHCYFKRLEFLGDAISLKGNGEMSFDQDIKLNFYTGVGKDSFRIPIISPLFGAASQNILLVQVDGTLTDPQVSKRLFPRLDDRLQEMFPDLEREVQAARSSGK